MMADKIKTLLHDSKNQAEFKKSLGEELEKVPGSDKVKKIYKRELFKEIVADEGYQKLPGRNELAEEERKVVLEKFDKLDRRYFNKIYSTATEQKSFVGKVFKALRSEEKDRFMPFIKLRAMIYESQFRDDFNPEFIQKIYDEIGSRIGKFNKEFTNIFQMELPSAEDILDENKVTAKEFKELLDTVNNLLSNDKLAEIKDFEKLYTSQFIKKSIIVNAPQNRMTEEITVPNGLYKSILLRKIEEDKKKGTAKNIYA